MRSIRARLFDGIDSTRGNRLVLAATVTYRRVLNETSTLFDYQLPRCTVRCAAKSPWRRESRVPPDQGDTDFVIQIWIFRARVYLSRARSPAINPDRSRYANLSLQGRPWRAYGLQTEDGVIQIAQPIQVRERLARAAALRVVVRSFFSCPS